MHQTAIKNDWKKSTLGEKAYEKREIHQITNKKEEFFYLGLEHIEQQNLQLKNIGSSKNVSSSKKKFKSGDILFGTLRPYFRKLYRPDFDGICSTDITVLNAKKNTNKDFLYYFLASDKFINYASQVSYGTKMPRASWKILTKSEWLFPPFNVQKKIGIILSNYCKLIEVNKRRIGFLDKISQSLYQEWFFNFRFPGYKDIEFENTKLGRIPNHWLAPLHKHIDFLEGPGLRRWQYRKNGIPFLNIRTLIPNDINLSKVQYLDSREVERSYKHFLLEPLDHVVSSSGTIGRISTIQEIHLPLMLNTSIIRMRPKSNKVGTWQLKRFLQSSYFQKQINAFAIGVAQKNYGPLHLKQMWIVAPDEKTAQLYEKIVEPLEKLILNLVKQNKNLLKQRDLLLNRLILGKIDVSKLDIKMDDEST